MAIDWSRFLGNLIHPMGILWVFLLLGVVTLLIRRKFRAIRFPLALAVVLSLIGSTNWTAKLLASLEKPYAAPDLKAVPRGDAILMLGGTHEFSSNDLFQLDLGPGADRLVTAIELARLGKAPVLVLGGGGQPARTDASLLEAWIKAWGLTTQTVTNLGACRNTYDEAQKMAALAKAQNWDEIILVSSAFHLKRAEAVFRKTGLKVIPIGADFQGLAALENDRAFYPVPRARGFDQLRLYLHEKVGWNYYRWRGWIETGKK